MIPEQRRLKRNVTEETHNSVGTVCVHHCRCRWVDLIQDFTLKMVTYIHIKEGKIICAAQ